MKAELPLLTLNDPSAPLFLLPGTTISRGRFAGMVTAMARRLPTGPLFDLCESRHAFTVTFAAAALRGGTALLPPASAGSMLEALGERYPGAPRLTDADVEAVATAPALDIAPRLSADRAAAIAFTSGSTGEPQAHVKTWRSLYHVGAHLSQRLLGNLGACSIVATVPPQHMYGIEATVMLPLAGGHHVAAGRPAFPNDIRAALEAVSAPRVLVTTPVHIRALLASGVRLPTLASIVSATAPLPEELAAKAEAAYATVVREIYGCTEAGTIGTRRTVEGDLWLPLEGIHIEQRDGVSLVHGEHLGSQPVPLQDVLELERGGIRLLGRTSDMIKVAGKRASLADLTLKLLSIPGVVDGVVFQPEARGDGVLLQRPAALVVAPGLSEGEILSALGRLVDPVFLPRPLRKLRALPRNPVGKLPHEQLNKLLVDG